MERRAAVDYLLEIAEQTNNSKFSSIVNDLARRVALSLEDKNVNLEKYCSKMAAELMFRDDYVNANKLLKLAENAPTEIPEELSVPDDLNQEEDTSTETEVVDEANKVPQNSATEATNFAEQLSAGGNVDVRGLDSLLKDLEAPENNPGQMVAPPSANPQQ
jgi:hypothetical protein